MKTPFGRAIQLWTALLLVLGVVFSFQGAVSAQDVSGDGPEVDPALLEAAERSDSLDFLIVFEEQADLSEAYAMNWEVRGRYVYDTLTATAAHSQADVRAFLDGEGASYQAFWAQNVIAVEGATRAAFEGLFTFTEIEALRVNAQVSLVEPESVEQEVLRDADRYVLSNLIHINADDAWALGYDGMGLVVGSIDTGARFTHETLAGHYRGGLGGGAFDHNYSWWDAVDGQDIAYDDHGHGTHTVGIMVGDDGGSNQIGIAPGAEWIACKAITSSGTGYDSDLLACGQFMLAPTDLEGNNADPDKRPQVVNNSWGDCGQTYDDWYESTITAWEAAGIYPVFANGNASNCSYAQPPGLNTVGNPARGFNVTGVGSTGLNNGEYATHSNWGPTDSLDTLNPNGYPDLKPQVVAPGAGITSAYAISDSSYAMMTGTSMSAPHVAGLITLMWHAGTCLVGDYVQTETLLQESATPIPYDTGSGNEGPGFVPNYATGWGEIDALQAVLDARDYCGNATLVGEVVDLGTSLPIAGATVTALAQGDPANDRQVQTGLDGHYLAPVQSGETFDLTASAYGYYEQAINDVYVATPGAVVENNFSLNPKAAVTLAGTVTDGSGQGYPLYARLTFTTGSHQIVTFTDPFDGTYSIQLYEDIDYEIEVSAMLNGYRIVSESGLAFAAPTAERDYALLVGDYCEAPGYLIASGLFQPFAGESLPSGWTLVDEAGEGVNWRFDDPAGRSNKTGGEGGFAIIDSRYAGLNLVDASLISPSNDFSGQMVVVVEFDQDFEVYPNSRIEVADVDVSINGGEWQTVLHQEEESVPGPNHQTVDISSLAADQSDVRIRFHYYNANFDWWWQVDNVRVGPYNCAVEPGGGLAGFVTDFDSGWAINQERVQSPNGSTLSQATPDDPALADGYYWLFQPLTSSPESVAITVGSGVRIPQTVDVAMTLGAVVRQDFALKSYKTYLPLLFK